jgi:hypothetical protein
MATAKTADSKDAVFEWEGKDRNGKQVRGEIRAASASRVSISRSFPAFSMNTTNAVAANINATRTTTTTEPRACADPRPGRDVAEGLRGCIGRRTGQ